MTTNQTLDLVARWLVRDLVDRTQQRSPIELTDAAFAVLHPELGGRRLAASEKALIAEYNRIRREIVQPVLGRPSAVIATTPAAPTSAAVRSGYRIAKNKQGLARYSIHEGGPRLEVALRALRDRGKLAIEDYHIDTFQRMSNVETGGGVQALNTWDSGIVSIGFFQLTLLHGKVQDLIRSAPDAFRRYGIELDEGRTYKIGGNTPVAIKGAATANELRWGIWADRFYRAGLDDDVIVAECEDGKQRLSRGIAVAKKKLGGAFELFWTAYKASLPMRGLYQEALNNLPVGAYNGIAIAAKQATDASGYYEILKRAIPAGFAAYGKQHGKEAKIREKGNHIVAKTAVLHYRS